MSTLSIPYQQNLYYASHQEGDHEGPRASMGVAFNFAAYFSKFPET